MFFYVDCLYSQPDINTKVYPDDDDDDDDDNSDDDHIHKGLHGYDPEYTADMSGIMYAFGCDIQDNKVIDEIEQVDHYDIFCELLGLHPKPNNGSHDVMRKIMSKFEEDSDSDEDDSESVEDNGDNVGIKSDGEEDNSSIQHNAFHSMVVLSVVVFLLTHHYMAY